MAKKISFAYDLTDDYTAFGISSHLKNYKLCWNLNKALNIDLSKLEDFSPVNKNAGDNAFPFFYFEDQNNRNEIFLLSNKKNSQLLFDKIPEADYILLIKGIFHRKKTDTLVSTLIKTSNIITVFLIDTKKIKGINTFLSEVELHIFNLITQKKSALSSTKRILKTSENL